MQQIYGLSLNDNLTPLQVRDAIGECFYQAHCLDSELSSDENITRAYCQTLVKKIFKDLRLDYENPTKASLTKVIAELAKFSRNFRSPEIIVKHFTEIETLLEHLS